VLARTILEEQRQRPLEQAHYHEWLSSNGAPWALFYRVDQDYLIRFIGHADVSISQCGEQLIVWPVPGVAAEAIDYLCVNLVEPLALSHQGSLVLHASAVEFGEHCVVFAAVSGGGKSTLAAYFATHGYRFLTDDAVLLEQGYAGYFVRPSHPTIRLWEDSTDELLSQGIGVTPQTSAFDKSRFLAEGKSLFCDETRMLRHIYFLGESDDAVSIEAVGGQDAVIKLLSNSFLLEIGDRQVLERNLKKISSLAREDVFFQLNYPRHYDSLREVRERLIAHVC